MSVEFQAFEAISKIDEQQVLFNWSKTTALAQRSQIWQPHDSAQLQALLQRFPERKIKVLGSGLSFEAIHSIYAESEDALLIDLSLLRGQLAQGPDWVTYQAATPVQDIYRDLIAMDRMLPVSPGVIGIQTLAGALSTGTHGQGLAQSSLCDAVLALTVMLANGEIIAVDSQDPRFGAFVMGLGALGIVLTVTVRTVANVIMRCTKLSRDSQWLFAHNEALNFNHQFVKSWWFAKAEQSHIWLVDSASEQEQRYYREHGSEAIALPCESSNNPLIATIDATLQQIALHTKDAAQQGQHFETVRRFKDDATWIGNVYQLLCKGIPAPQINCELAIPLAKVNEALAALQAWQQAYPDALHYPFILRYTGASQAWLSGAYGQPVCWIGFLVYLAADGSFVEGSMAQMAQLQKLLAPFGAIPHFGKHLLPALYDFPTLLPRWQDFIALKQQLDPYGRFSNQWLDNLFASAKESA